MSEHTSHESEAESTAISVPFYKRFMLPILIACGVFLLLIFLFIGLAIGRAMKSKNDVSQYTKQIAQLNTRLGELESERTMFEVKSVNLQRALEKAGEETVVLRTQLAEKERNEQVAAARASEAAAAASGTAHATINKPTEKPQSREYVRFSNQDCKLTIGQSGQVWDCVKQSIGGVRKPAAPTQTPTPPATQGAEAAPHKTTKPAADPHAKPAH